MELLEQHFGDIVRGLSNTPQTIALNDPWDMDETTFRYSDPARKNPVPGFGIEFNRALYLLYKDGKEYPNEPIIQNLNEALQSFLTGLIEVFDV